MQRQVRFVLGLVCLLAWLQPLAHGQKILTRLLLSANPSPSVQSNTSVFFSLASSAADGSIPSPITLSIMGSATPLATLYPNASGLATYVTQFSSGSLVLEADYAGDATHLPASAFIFIYVQSVSLGDSINIYDLPNPSLVNQPVTIYVTEGTGLQGGFPMLPVTNGFVPYCILTFTKGLGSCQHTFTALGNYIVDVYVTTGTSSEDRHLTQRVVSATTTDTNLFATPTRILRGQTTRLIASTATAYDGTPGVGTIYFRDGTVPLGSGPLTGFGESATMEVSTLLPGTHTIFADFVSSDPRFDNSTSSAVTVAVSDDDFTLTAPSSLSIQTSHHVLTPISLASLGVFADTIHFGCSNLPQYSSCIFQPAQQSLTAGSSAIDTLWVDTDQVIGYAANTTPPIPLPKIIVAAGLLAGLCLGRRRVRAVLLTLMLGIVFISLTACSGKLPLSTPPGTYNFVVTGQGATTSVSHSVPIQLTVTP